MRREARLVAAAGAAFVCAVAVLVDAPQPLRAIAGALLVLILPGIAIVAAVTRRRPWPAEHAVLVIASSMAAVILGGLALDRLPGGLQEESWALYLAYATVLVVIVAAVRRPPGRRLASRLRQRAVPRPTSRQVALLVTAALLAAVAVGIAHASEDAATRRTPIVQLWMLQSRGADATTLRIGVDAENARATVYRLEVRSGDGAPTVWQVPVDGPTQWRAIVEIPRGAPQRVDALLFPESEPETAVRRVRQWVR